MHINDHEYCVVVLNESLCPSNCKLAYDLINEFNPNYVKVIFESKHINYVPMLNKTFSATIQNGVEYYLDTQGDFSSVHVFSGNPLLLYCKSGKIVASRYITYGNYETITKEFSKFITANLYVN